MPQSGMPLGMFKKVGKSFEGVFARPSPLAGGPGVRFRAPGGGQEQCPSRGPGGSAPGSSWILELFSTLGGLFFRLFSIPLFNYINETT